MPLTRPVEAVRLPRRRRSGCAPATPFEHELAELAARRATGVLAGEHGRVHLAEGAVVYAESHSAPGVEALLTGCGRISSAEWASLLGSCSATGRPLGELLVRAGLVTTAELQLCLTTAVLDAAFFALGPAARPPFFTPSAVPLLTLARPMTVRQLRAAVGRRRALLDRVWPAPPGEHGPVLRRRTGGGPAHPARSCTLRRRAVLEAADGLRTPSEIALLLGRSAFTTLLDLRHLAAVGLLETPVPAAPATAATPVTGLTPAVVPVVPVVPVPPYPATVPTTPAAPTAPQAPQVPQVPPTAAARQVPSVPPPRSAPPAPTRPTAAVPVITSLPTPTAPGRPPVTQPSPAYDPSDPHVALLLRIRAGLEARL
ncbi:transcriptional regulator [Kitasatospora sp. NPDC004289]